MLSRVVSGCFLIEYTLKSVQGSQQKKLQKQRTHDHHPKQMLLSGPRDSMIKKSIQQSTQTRHDTDKCHATQI